MKKIPTFPLLALVFLMFLGSIAYLVAGGWFGGKGLHRGYLTNQSYVNGLYENVNVLNSRDVFRQVFAELPEKAVVYPSEGYYYFRTTIRGRLYAGSFGVTPDRVDHGTLGFSFTEIPSHRDIPYNPMVSSLGRDFGDSDGVAVKKRGDMEYDVSFEEKTVKFTIYEPGIDPPKKARLTDDEVFVGPSFDESGLRFFLIFNKPARRLYWVLNEDGFVAEQFTPFSDNVVVGDRTEFAFYPDTANTRKILVGVQADNVKANNWLDGPFDQLPDYYVKTGKVELRKYLAAHLGLKEDALDQYGRYKGQNVSRVAIAPYTIYTDQAELGFVDSVLALGISSTELYSRITKDTPYKLK